MIENAEISTSKSGLFVKVNEQSCVIRIFFPKMAYDVQLKKEKNARIFYDVKIGSEMNGNVAE